MVKNTTACADLVFQLIRDNEITKAAPKGSYTFFDMNV